MISFHPADKTSEHCQSIKLSWLHFLHILSMEGPWKAWNDLDRYCLCECGGGRSFSSWHRDYIFYSLPLFHVPCGLNQNFSSYEQKLAKNVIVYCWMYWACKPLPVSYVTAFQEWLPNQVYHAYYWWTVWVGSFQKYMALLSLELC